jgi:anti-sigma-K factor RskA
MNELKKEKMLDLLIKQLTEGLSPEETAQLRELEKEFPALKDDQSFEQAAGAISMANLDTSEPLPANLRSRISADADKFFVADEKEEYQKTFAFEPKRRSWQWLGWAFAAVAVAILALNLWTTRMNPKVERVYVQITPTPTPSANQQLEQFLAAPDVVKTSMTNPKNPNEVVGDVVWSDSLQKGFVRLRGVPVNDKTREQYQLWIVAANQDAKTPVDGGVFDVSDAGEVIIPITAKVKVEKPAAFAITAEKPGGVVVSKGEKVMAVAKLGA